MIPKGWTETPLGELTANHRPICYGVVQPGEHDAGGVQFIRGGDIQDGRISPHLRTISTDVSAQYKRTLLQGGELVIALVGYIGEAAIVPVSLAGANIARQVGLIALNNEVHHEYVLHFLRSPLGKDRLLHPTIGSAQQVINIADLKRIQIVLPPIVEQGKLAAILSTWDRAIELIERLIAAKQQRKAALMQLLLTGNVRLPGFGGTTADSGFLIASLPRGGWRGIYPPSVQPGIPKIEFRPTGWEETTMQKLIRIHKRLVELEPERVYQLVVAKRNRGGIEPREQLRGSEIKTPTQFEVHEGDFVISRRQIIHGACGVVPSPLAGAIVSNEYAVCRVNGKLNIDFLRYLTHTLYFQQTCFHSSVGVTLEKMIFRLEKWLAFPFLIPPIKEQEAVSAVLNKADEEISLLTRKLDALRRQKKGLMQQLLTGKVRVTVPEPPAE